MWVRHSYIIGIWHHAVNGPGFQYDRSAVSVSCKRVLCSENEWENRKGVEVQNLNHFEIEALGNFDNGMTITSFACAEK